MSLISLLIALAAERYLSSPIWQFKSFYSRYLNLIKQTNLVDSPWQSIVTLFAFIIVPVLISYLLLDMVENSVLHLVLSTLILIVCFGCVKTRECYKNYLMSAFRGETTTCELHHSQLLNDKQLSQMGFGQMLIWLNYRYFIAIMIFFVLFGAPGALFYRLLTTVAERTDYDNAEESEEAGEESTSEILANKDDETFDNENETKDDNESDFVFSQAQLWLSWVDWLPVRLVAFGYMFVGHFSKALPMWLESVFEFNKAPHQVLIDVAEKSEDFMVDKDDCTAEPCLLVRLAKRTSLLCLAVIASLIVTGVIQ